MSWQLRVTSREARVINRDAMHRRCATDALETRASQRATRVGVTLVELLVTITIISILSAAFLGTSQLAMESSRKARTKTTIGKIHGLLMEKWNEYATRRVDVHPALIAELEDNILNGGNWTPDRRKVRGVALADLRLLATRELMKLEMPDRWADVAINDIPSTNPTNVAFGYQSVLASLPAVTRVYRRRLASLNSGMSRDTLVENQGAECLYMIIMNTTADGEARTLFSEHDIGDTDGDGAPEFLDGWRRPIDFIRWPAGFYPQSDLMVGPQVVDPVTNQLTPSDHDTTDVFRRDEVTVRLPAAGLYRFSLSLGNLVPQLGEPPVEFLVDEIRTRNGEDVLDAGSAGNVPVGAFRLLPLVFSWGPDGISDIDSEVLGLQFTRSSLDPYAIDSSDRFFDLGQANFDGGDDNSLDNIHNHLQDNR